MLLYYKGIVARPNDIDLLLALEDTKEADRILCAMGVKHPPNAVESYGTKYFYEYTIGNVDVDVMAGFVINYPGGAYEYHLDASSLEQEEIEGALVYLCPLEDWYVLYQLMPKREARAEAVGEYLGRNARNAERLRFWLEEDIPARIKANVNDLLWQ